MFVRSHPQAMSGFESTGRPNQPFGSLSSALSPTPSTNLHPGSTSNYPSSTLPLDSSRSLHQERHLSVQDFPQTISSTVALAPHYNVGAALSRSLSADAAAPQQPTPSHLVQRLAQQNKLIRDAWEAERNYLEVNRRRAEEVYQEERIIMEEERDTWEAERNDLQRELQDLRERVLRLEGENGALRSMLSQGLAVSGIMSPQASQRGGSADNSAEGSTIDAPSSTKKPTYVVMPPTNPVLSPAMVEAATASDMLPPGLEGASRRPHFASPLGGQSRQSPTQQPDTSPFIPLEPRVEPQKPGHDFLALTEETSAPIPVIDVQEIDPKLEGIPIKASAISKPTFPATSSATGSPATSPPVSDPNQLVGQTQSSGPGRTSSKDHTLQVLRAAESQRLTMHAGHTPNHSLSLFPTIKATGGSVVSVLSEEATPTAEAVTILGEEGGDSEASDAKLAEEPKPTELERLEKEYELEPPLDPVDDVPLRGPLMIRNVPAHDEIFLAQIDKLLVPISEGQDALPTVVRAVQKEDESSGPDTLQKMPNLEEVELEAGNDNKNVEADVPLRLRSTSNFGQPFGKV